MIILAPRASGKSYAAKHNPLILDGDLLIAQGPGWPKGDWWKEEDAELVHRRNWTHLLQEEVKSGGRIIIFNGKGFDAGEVPVLVLIPTEARLRRNIETHPHALRGGHTPEERHAETMARNVPGLIGDAERHRWPLIVGEAADEFLDWLATPASLSGQ
jgi:hypothetical protein